MGQAMRILVTNDDGINAEGLGVLEAIAAEIAGDTGEVWIVAPSTERSGVAHCISYTTPMMVTQHGPRRFSVDGYPADCVLAGVHHVLKDTPPDLILSGVNRGNNSAENALYSGTLGAAIEGAMQGIVSIALSQYFGPKMANASDKFEASRTYGAKVVKSILDQEVDNQSDYMLFYNVNFPPVPAKDVKGIKTCPQGYRNGTCFGADLFEARNGRHFLFVRGGDQHIQTTVGTDAALNLEGYVSVTPMRADLTAHDVLPQLKGFE